MPVNTLHPSYEKMSKKVKRVRDFARGDDAVKEAGETYVERLAGQSDKAYAAYLSRGGVVPAITPTAKAIGGAIMRKSPVFNPSDVRVSQSIDGMGQTVNDFVECIIYELLIAGGSGYLVEYSEDEKHNVFRQYTRENIINEGPGFIVLRQFYQEQDPKDKFEVKTKAEYLELTYDENGNYIQNLWREVKGKYVVVDTFTPTKSGDPLDKIPFVFSYAGDTFWDSDPMLLNMTNVNWLQYMKSVDRGHGLHFTAIPTLCLFGDDGREEPLRVGADTFNHITDSDARIELVEFTGAGLAAYDKAIQDDIATMAAIGARMLLGSDSGVRAAETARIEASSETATLSGIANIVDMVMRDLLNHAEEWTGLRHDGFAVNRDFLDVKIDPSMLSELLKALMAGAISQATFLHNLKKGEIIPDDVTAEQEAGRIETTGFDFGAE